MDVVAGAKDLYYLFWTCLECWLYVTRKTYATTRYLKARNEVVMMDNVHELANSAGRKLRYG
jgi:hypothetical protein